MKNSCIETIGVYSQKDIDNYDIKKPFKEFCKNLTITLPDNISDIKKIQKIILKPEVNYYKKIFSQDTCKFFVVATINFKIFFSTCDKDTKYSITRSKKFSEIIILQRDDILETKPVVFIEDVFAKIVSKNKIYLSMLIGLGDTSNLDFPGYMIDNNVEAKKNSLIKNISLKDIKNDATENSLNIELNYDMKEIF